MVLVLTYLSECGSARSRDVAQKLPFISPKYASLVLTRCSRRGFVSRQPYKQGREHGYVYKLTNKGAEWILYKFSQKRTHYRKPPKQVGNEDVPVQNVMILEPNGTRQENEAFTFLKNELSLVASLNLYSNACQSQKQQFNVQKERDFWGTLALIRLSRDNDAIRHLCREHLSKSSGRNQKEKAATSSGSLRGSWSTAPETKPGFESRSVKFFQRGQLQGLKHGLKLGIAIGETRQLKRDQNALLTILNKKFRSRNFNNTHITTLPMASAKTPKIEKPTKVTSKPASTPQNIAVKEPGEDKDDWTEMNCWWRHLPKEYIKYDAHPRALDFSRTSLFMH